MEQPITYEPATHRGEDVIFIRFVYYSDLNERVRRLPGVPRPEKRQLLPNVLAIR